MVGISRTPESKSVRLQRGGGGTEREAGMRGEKAVLPNKKKLAPRDTMTSTIQERKIRY